MNRKIALLTGIALWVSGMVYGQQEGMAREEIAGQAKTKFEEKKYGEALFFLNKLLEMYPRDPGYAYSAGVCYTELNRDLAKAVDYLSFAAAEGGPENVYYYLGKAYFQQADYPKALENFRKYTEVGKKQEQKELLVDSYLEMCESRINPSTTIASTPKLTSKTTAVSGETKASQPAAQPLNKGEMTALSAYDLEVQRSLRWQSQADSVKRLTDQKRSTLAQIKDPGQKQQAEAEILRLEQQGYELQKKASAGFEAAGKMEQQGMATQQEEPSNETAKPDVTPTTAESFSSTFYKEKEFRKLFRSADLESLEEMESVVKSADKLMVKSNGEDAKIKQLQLQADAAKNKSEQKKYLNKIDKQKKSVLELRLKALDYYQLVNGDKYSLFGKTLDGTGVGRAAKEVEGSGMYRKYASDSYGKAAVIRKQADKQTSGQKRYEMLLEANTYELVALENQKRAFETLLGLRTAEPPRAEPLPYLQEVPVKAQQPTQDQQAASSQPLIKDIPKEKEVLPVTAMQQEKNTITEPVPMVGKEEKPKTAEGKQGDDAQPKRVAEKTVAEPASEPVPAITPLVDRPSYFVQLAVLSNPPGANYFKSIQPVSSEFIPESKLTRYFTGDFISFDAAQRALTSTKTRGFPQAFIFATYEGKRISVNRARVLEQGTQTVVASGQEHPKQKIITGGKMPVYKVQVGAFRGEVPSSLIAKFTQAAPEYPLEKYINNAGITIYSLGNFYTFEEAAVLRNRLVRSGVNDAFIVAYLEGEKIAVEQARKITSGQQ